MRILLLMYNEYKNSLDYFIVFEQTHKNTISILF